MTTGSFRNGHPRIMVDLPGLSGALMSIEFIIDTGYEGDISLPAELIPRIAATESGSRRRGMADGTIRRVPIYRANIEWAGETRTVELLAMGHQPLIGTDFMRDMLLQVEVAEHGEVSLEPL